MSMLASKLKTNSHLTFFNSWIEDSQEVQKKIVEFVNGPKILKSIEVAESGISLTHSTFFSNLYKKIEDRTRNYAGKLC